MKWLLLVIWYNLYDIIIVLYLNIYGNKSWIIKGFKQNKLSIKKFSKSIDHIGFHLKAQRKKTTINWREKYDLKEITASKIDFKEKDFIISSKKSIE